MNMIKTCSYCKKEKDISLFAIRLRKDGSNRGTSRCKKCISIITMEYQKKNLKNRREAQKKFYYKNKSKVNEYTKKYYTNKKDGSYYVYLLPEEHYCGQTDSIYYRKSNHKSIGRYVEDIDVVLKFKTRKEALQLEAAFHNLGWLGRYE